MAKGSLRINGFDQIKFFYSIVFEQRYEIKPQHISLYIFFINQNNRNNWVEWFKCPYDLAMAGSCIGSKKTYYTCLHDLKEWGFIDYEKGTNEWKSPKIKVEVLKCTSAYTSSVPQGEPLPIPLPIQSSSINLKPITLNLKQEIALPFSEKFKTHWEIWKEYKWNEHKQNYRSLESEQAAVNELVEFGNNSEKTCIEIINKSMSKTWKNLFKPDKHDAPIKSNVPKFATLEEHNKPF